MKKHKSNKTRVAVYIRIGGPGDCISACEKQKAHFTEIIIQNTDWELTQVYADLGKESRKQPNLGRLMADCRAGRVDLIITKSTSRISRSMNVLMGIVRELAYLKPPVGVYFEDTKLNTLEKDNFLFLTMFEAMAIRESETKGDSTQRRSLSKHFKRQEKAQIKKKKEKPE